LSRIPTLLEEHLQLLKDAQKAKAAEQAAEARLRSQLAVPTSLPTVAAKRLPPVDLAAPHCAQRPDEYPSIESRALSTFDDNPLFGTCEAAEILAVGVDLLKKWRRRNQGPDYVQYGPGGPVRYEVDALKAFRARQRVRVSYKP
jgi:hypothetical protein